MQGNCLSILDIIQGSTSVIGVIVSVVGIIISVWTARRSYRISLYERRKNSFDFFKDYIDDWRYFYDYRGEDNTEKAELLIALNGFCHDKLEQGNYKQEDYPYMITKGYNFQIRQLEDLVMYFHFAKKRREYINKIIFLMELYYRSLIRYFDRFINYPEKLDKSIEQLKVASLNFFAVIDKEENDDIVKWMKKQLMVK